MQKQKQKPLNKCIYNQPFNFSYCTYTNTYANIVTYKNRKKRNYSQFTESATMLTLLNVPECICCVSISMYVCVCAYLFTGWLWLLHMRSKSEFCVCMQHNVSFRHWDVQNILKQVMCMHPASKPAKSESKIAAKNYETKLIHMQSNKHIHKYTCKYPFKISTCIDRKLNGIFK